MKTYLFEDGRLYKSSRIGFVCVEQFNGPAGESMTLVDAIKYHENKLLKRRKVDKPVSENKLKTVQDRYRKARRKE